MVLYQRKRLRYDLRTGDNKIKHVSNIKYLRSVLTVDGNIETKIESTFD